jgi:hypothetical protein
MPHDLPLLLLCVVPAAVVALGIGIALRRYRPRLCERYAAWSSTLPWWVFVTGTMFFLLMAGWQVSRGWWSFAALFAAGALLDLVAMGFSLGRRTAPGSVEHGSASEPGRR